jgi:RNA polymerase sigma factor (sigma-70 family)
MDERHLDEQRVLAERFEEHRGHLRSVAQRMLGSAAEADDAVQEAWLRLSRADVSDVANLRAWLTTVVTRVCLNALRSRATRREEPLTPAVPDPVVSPEDGPDPEAEAVLADSVGLAMLVVLDALEPAERVAFVLHDMFGVPFEDIAPMVGRTPVAARQLASRARRRVRGAGEPEADRVRRRAVVDAFFAAARGGDLERLVTVLDPEVVLRSDGGRLRVASAVVRGADAVARRAAMFSRPDAVLHPALVNGATGVVVTVRGRPTAVMEFTVAGGVITAIDVLADPDRLAELDLGPGSPG